MQGYLKYKGYSCVFTYSDGLLQIVNKNISNKNIKLRFSQKKFSENILIAQTNNNGIVVFFNCDFSKIGLSGFVARPAGYAEFNTKDTSFDAITFKGDVINCFYRPNQIIDDDKSDYKFFERNDSFGKLVFKPFSKITISEMIEIDKHKAKMILSISTPNIPTKVTEKFNLGTVNSIMRIEFTEKQPIEHFALIYSWVLQFFKFLNFSISIKFDNISVSSKNSDGVFNSISDVFIQPGYEIMEINFNKNIGYFLIKDHINELLKITNLKHLNFLFLPKSFKDDKTVDPIKFLSCCSSFESLFNYCFPNQKEEESANFKQAKQDILSFIDLKRDEYKGKKGKVRECLKSFKTTINLQDFSLEEKINFGLKKYQNSYYDVFFQYCQVENLISTNAVIDDMGDNNCVNQRAEVNDILTQIASTVREYRNSTAHESLMPLDRIHILGYSTLRILIYCMILDYVNIEEHLIKNAINNLFGR